VLSGRGLCDELITRPEKSYRLCCVVVCDLETSRIGAPYTYIHIYIYDISTLRVKLLTLFYVSRGCILIRNNLRVCRTDTARAILLPHKDIRITEINMFLYASNNRRYAFKLSFLLSKVGVQGGAVG